MNNKNIIKFSESKVQYMHMPKSDNSYCIYCGEFADTREHLPSRILLNYPLPDMYIVPACKECNYNYSADEIYLAYIANYLASKYYNRKLSQRHQSLLENNIPLQNHVYNLIDKTGEAVLNIAAIKKILRKFALGHISFWFDKFAFEDDYDVECMFATEVSEGEINIFNKLEEMDVMPEVGCRACQNLCCSDTGALFATWDAIQEDQYRYMVFACKNDIVVKIVIGEFIFAKITFQQ